MIIYVSVVEMGISFLYVFLGDILSIHRFVKDVFENSQNNTKPNENAQECKKKKIVHTRCIFIGGLPWAEW